MSRDWFLEGMLRATFEFAQLAIKQLILINGGAVVAALGYLGATANGPHPPDATGRALVAWALRLFALGVAFAAASAIAAYGAQRADYERHTGHGRWLTALMNPAIIVAAVSMGASLASFSAGALGFARFLSVKL